MTDAAKKTITELQSRGWKFKRHREDRTVFEFVRYDDLFECDTHKLVFQDGSIVVNTYEWYKHDKDQMETFLRKKSLGIDA